MRILNFSFIPHRVKQIAQPVVNDEGSMHGGYCKGQLVIDGALRFAATATTPARVVPLIIDLASLAIRRKVNGEFDVGYAPGKSFKRGDETVDGASPFKCWDPDSHLAMRQLILTRDEVKPTLILMNQVAAQRAAAVQTASAAQPAPAGPAAEVRTDDIVGAQTPEFDSTFDLTDLANLG